MPFVRVIRLCRNTISFFPLRSFRRQLLRLLPSFPVCCPLFLLRIPILFRLLSPGGFFLFLLLVLRFLVSSFFRLSCLFSLIFPNLLVTSGHFFLFRLNGQNGIPVEHVMKVLAAG